MHAPSFPKEAVAPIMTTEFFALPSTYLSCINGADPWLLFCPQENQL